MYDGSIKLTDISDIPVLKQEVELLSSLNSQLKEFSGLKLNIETIWSIFLNGKPTLSNLSDSIKQVTSASNELKKSISS